MLGMTTVTIDGIAIGVALIAIFIGVFIGSHLGKRELRNRIASLVSRLGDEVTITDKNPESVIAHLEAATDRAAEAIAESSADAIRLRRTLDTLPQGVIVCNETNTIIFKNQKAAALMSGRYADALAAQAVTELLQQAWQSGEAERTIELYGPPRRTLWVHTQLIDDGRRTVGVAATIDDVSEKRHLEEVRRDFVANVSHELKTPIGALGLLAETLLDENDPMLVRRLANRINQEAFRVSRIIDDLLDLSRIESEESPLRSPVPLDLILAEATERIRFVAEQRGITISVQELNPPYVLFCDRRQMTSAIYNLLENAVKFSYDNGQVEISVSSDETNISISVRDYGVGIPSRELERIFERFYRVDPGRSRQTGGTGLGLSIVRHVANNHKGTISVESREGEGSVFTLTIPLGYPSPSTSSAESSYAEKPETEAPAAANVGEPSVLEQSLSAETEMARPEELEHTEEPVEGTRDIVQEDKGFDDDAFTQGDETTNTPRPASSA
ncbi:MAG: ATP-binding protein [Actinobacteria bacterium]|jgi:two-component system sensor histidine kinase SenX3|nr:ATP-binding protein [Actinomycetota bacterium]